MTTTALIVQYLDDLLDTNAVPDFANALNGLQLANTGSVSRIAAAVDFSLRTVTAAADTGADLLIVHHGMFWSGLQPIRGTAAQRLRTLITRDMAVYSSHLPLDRHALYGNNALLAAELGLEPSGEFARFRNISIGVTGESSVATTELAARASRFARLHGGSVRTTPIEPERSTRRWAICTGAGAGTETLNEARERGIDTLIVGEGAHHTAVEAEESGITIIYAGHYATETLGVCAIAAHVSDRFGVPWAFIEAPTGL
jgi:dinuclear metal center YbgI/SA1388 family protein